MFNTSSTGAKSTLRPRLFPSLLSGTSLWQSEAGSPTSGVPGVYGVPAAGLMRAGWGAVQLKPSLCRRSPGLNRGAPWCGLLCGSMSRTAGMGTGSGERSKAARWPSPEKQVCLGPRADRWVFMLKKDRAVIVQDFLPAIKFSTSEVLSWIISVLCRKLSLLLNKQF